MQTNYGNRQKHESKNPLQRALIGHFHDQLAHAIAALAPEDILDVGCGEGYVARALRDRGICAPMTGIDQSAEAIEDARRRVPEASFAVMDALELVREKRTYDLVMMIEVLEHIPQPERMLPILDALARRYVVLSVPWEPFFRGLNFLRGKHVAAWGNDPEHINHWGRKSFMRFLGERFFVRAAPWVFPWTLLVCEPLQRLPARSPTA